VQAVAIVVAIGAQARGQAPPAPGLVPFGRLEAGAVNPGSPFNVALAVGVSAGVEWRRRFAIVVGFMRQSQGDHHGTDLTGRARSLLLVGGEFGFGPDGPLERELRLRAGTGVVVRPDLATAPVLSAGIALRQRMASHLRLFARFDDVLMFAPRQDFRDCSGSGPVICTSVVVPQTSQHNFGGVIGLEWRP
jgi:hypothetical protein